MNSLDSYLSAIKLPEKDSHKGENGKVLIIGGSDLFHAASKWSLDVVSKFVDMVFYASIPSNAELVQAAKGEFWNGIVISLDEIEEYIQESDAVLIGPGMTRTQDTEQLVNTLLQKYPTTRWVIDAGAVQMVDPQLLTETCIITPHRRELERLVGKNSELVESLPDREAGSEEMTHFLQKVSGNLHNCTVLFKGVVDVVVKGDQTQIIEGGNEGMTHGGTGDVLAGLVAALYAKNDAVTASVVASYINKAAGDFLYQSVGPFYNASDLVEAVPKVFWEKLQELQES